MKQIVLPKFLLAENPTEDIDRFVYIYSPVYLSLILIISEDIQTVILNKEIMNNTRKTYNYKMESFEFVILQNNVLSTGGKLAPKITEYEFLDQAWNWWEEYLKWEDRNIEEDEIAKFN